MTPGPLYRVRRYRERETRTPSCWAQSVARPGSSCHSTNALNAACWGLRAELELFANLRPAITYPQLADASSLKSELVAGLDVMIVRELTGGIYFGTPRGVRQLESGEREGFNTLIYRESEIERIAHNAFAVARKRGRRVCSVDKANVLECTELWREVVTDVAKQYSDCEISHMYVDNAAMQLVRQPKQFDVIVTTNMFGDILSDIAAMLTGSIGMLPSASLDANGKGMYEPVHGLGTRYNGPGQSQPTGNVAVVVHDVALFIVATGVG